MWRIKPARLMGEGALPNMVVVVSSGVIQAYRSSAQTFQVRVPMAIRYTET